MPNQALQPVQRSEVGGQKSVFVAMVDVDPCQCESISRHLRLPERWLSLVSLDVI